MTISILPKAEPVFVDAVRSAGGETSEFGDSTDGLIWLDPKGSEQLDRVLAERSTVRWVQLPFAGVDAFSWLFPKYPSITWTSAKGAYSETVAEHALALTLALLRDLPERSRTSTWGEQSGRSLFRRHVAVVGAGGIGREYITLIAPFHTHVTAVRRSSRPVDGADQTITTEEFRSRLGEFDVVMLSAALTDETRHLLGAAEFATLPEHAVVVNVGRGPLIDTDALVGALREGKIHGAGLDVTEPEPLPDGHPLWSEPRALITPHVANTWEMAKPYLSNRVSENVAAFLEKGEWVGLVDPEAGY